MGRVWDAPGCKLSLSSKVLVFNTCVRSILLFGSECWAPTEAHAKQLDVFQNDCLRRMLGKRRSDRIPLERIRAECHVYPICSQLRSIRLRQLGHVMRMPFTRLPKVALFAQLPDACRPRGRPPLSWHRLVVDDCASCGVNPASLLDLCHDRASCAKIVKHSLTLTT